MAKNKKELLVECARCSVPYPDWYLHHAFGSMVQGYVCGVCALEIANAIHGTPMRRRFSGDMAQEALWLAREWRRRNPVLVQKAREAARA
jgi:hypothetical protein